jgi:hypothetical protein
MKRFLPFGLVAAAVAALIFSMQFGVQPAVAQSTGGAACAIDTQGPIEDATTSRTFTANDNCKMYVFTSGSSVTATIPAPTTLPNGWSVWVKSQGAGTVSVTPTGTTLDGLSSALALTTGTFGRISCTHAQCYSFSLGIKHP